MRYTYIVVKWQWPGFHEWADAPDEVAFLRHPHRHLFKATARLDVLHEDRELEFFLVLRYIEETIMPKVKPASCEQMANQILDELKEKYGPGRGYVVEVSEDGENAGGVEWQPQMVVE